KILKKYVNGVYKTRDASGNSIVQKAEGGICMVMDARTGEILASAVAPDYTPGPDTGADKKGLQRNRAFCDAFEPGSILKVFTAAAALKYGATPNSTYYTENTLMVDGWPINNSHSIASGYWTISDIIIESLNTGTAAIALDLGREKLSKTLHEFGFGEFSGVVNKNSHVACERNGQIVSGEETGAFGFWNWKDWSKCDTCVISFGQAATVTPIQICSAMQAVANGGRRMQPRIVKRVVDDDGNVKLDYPIVEKNRPISEEAAAGLTDMLIKVVSEGTGQAAAVPGYQVAGKTGTAQVVDSERGGYKEGCYNAAFVGYVPARNPRIVVLVKMENPSPDIYGGSVCGPIFKEICQHVLPYLGCLPDDAK
ncbi:penicillin-binding protein 2, partial [bacterium]|nr:penicillin-binding protein 2 [bacterium]